jgi:uncharacterized membrane protein
MKPVQPLFHSHSPRINVPPDERFVSIAAGSLLLYSAIRGRHSFIKGALATFLFYRGITGHCPAYSAIGKRLRTHPLNINVRTAITINKPRHEVYLFWRKLENLPRFMKHLESVTEIDAVHSTWKAKLPGWPLPISWEARIVKDKEDELLGWRSYPGADIENAGKIEFKDAGENGTEIHAVITYRAPLGKAGEKIARLLTPAFEMVVHEDLRNFRRYIETGEIPTIEGQPFGRKHKKSILSFMN